jgi:hypothetical protein
MIITPEATFPLNADAPDAPLDPIQPTEAVETMPVPAPAKRKARAQPQETVDTSETVVAAVGTQADLAVSRQHIADLTNDAAANKERFNTVKPHLIAIDDAETKLNNVTNAFGVSHGPAGELMDDLTLTLNKLRALVLTA